MNPHIINTDSIHENAFYLLTICASAKNIARRFDLSDENKNFVNNYRGYLPSKVSQVLIDTAIKVRLIQDIVSRLEDDSDQMKEAERELNRIYDMGFSISGDQDITLRFACNKIIHATEIHLIKENGEEENELVYCAREDGEEIEIEWEYFDGRVPDGHPKYPICGHLSLPHLYFYLRGMKKEENMVIQVPIRHTELKYESDGGALLPGHKWGIFKWPSGELIF